jgi:CDGSH-type Zn-finger protein
MNRFETASTAPVGVVVECDKTDWWCACGLSKKQPFCDGSRKRTSLSPVQYMATETGPKFICVCKRTQSRPFRNGSHNQSMTSESDPPLFIQEA